MPRRGLIGTTIVLALIALGAVVAGRAFRQPQLASPALPVLPSAPGHPAAFRDRLEQAQATARNAGTRLNGIHRLGRLYHANGFGAEAEICWQILAVEAPTDARWGYYLAALMRERGDDTAMASWLGRTTTLAPDYAPAWLQLGDWWFKTGEPAPAEQAYRQRLALLPDDPHARLGLARVSLQQGREAEARAALERLVTDTPGFAPAHNLLAQILATAGETARAQQERARGTAAGRFRAAADPWLNELLDDCFDYERLCVAGVTEVLTGEADRGRALLERALELRPDALGAYEALGNLYLDRGDGERAVVYYEQGRRQATSPPPSAGFFVNLARAYNSMGKPAIAMEVLRQGLEQTGEGFELSDALGSTLVVLGLPAEAVAAHRAALLHQPKNADGHYHLAQALIADGQLEAAVAALQDALALQPTHPGTLALLAQIEMDSGRWQSALQYLQPLYDARPDLPDARAKMAFARLQAGTEAEQEGNPVSAEQHYRGGLALEPAHPELLAHLGLLLLVQRRPQEAIPPLQAYHRLGVSSGPGPLLLGQAYAAVGRHAEARVVLDEGARAAEQSGATATAERCRELLARLP